MEQSNIKIIDNNGAIILEKEGKKISIWQTVDDDVWIAGNEDETCFEFNLYVRNYIESAISGKFKDLMVSIIGKYMLEDANDRISLLPEDFIDLKNRTIIWHSDNGNDNVLKLVYEDKTIRLFIIKGQKSKSNTLRVRTDGSEYKYYYREFIDLFNDLRHIYNINCVLKESEIAESTSVPNNQPEPTDKPSPKKLSLKRFFQSKKQ